MSKFVLMRKGQFVYLLLSVQAIVYLFVLFYFDGTGDSGDSIHHFLFSKYAFDQPSLLLNHWGKPLFTLLSAPFAQFGIIGIKFFNMLCTLWSTFVLIKLAQHYNFKWPGLAVLLVATSPVYFVLTFSGLTEVLCAAMLITAIGLMTRNQSNWALVIVSFLPFVRSEGLIFVGVFAVYLLLSKRWKPIAWLATGHVVYSVIGFFYYRDFLWIFNRIPYARLNSVYGDGDWWHFFNQLYYVVGLPQMILFWLGVALLIWVFIQKKPDLIRHFLIPACFFALFVAHSIFWVMGIFNSMGLSRVLVAVIPMAIWMMLEAVEYFWSKGNAVKWGVGLGLIWIFIFPFTKHPAAVKWDRDLQLKPDQLICFDIAQYVNNQNMNPNRWVYTPASLSFALDINHFDTTQRLEMTPKNLSNLKVGDFLIWDNWFTPTEYAITSKSLRSVLSLKEVRRWSRRGTKKEHLYILYEVK